MRVLLVIVISALVAACGLRLAEREPLPESLQRVRLQLPADARDFAPLLRDALRARGVRIVAASDGPEVTLIIHRLIAEERVLSVSAGGTPLESELSLTVIFSLTDAEGDRIPRETLVLTRDLTWDATRVLAKESEAEILSGALQQEAARRIVSRYARAGG